MSNSSNKELDRTGATDRYEVGYKKPPKDHRFKKGQSGNPKGRPKKQRPEQIDVNKILDKPVVATRNGKKTKVPPNEVSVRAIAQAALNKDIRSIKIFLDLAERAELVIVPEPRTRGGVIKVPKGLEVHEFKVFLDFDHKGKKF